MNKPASQGTHLPWHQDGGDVWKLDRDPLVTTWIALDPATRSNGCVEVIPGTRGDHFPIVFGDDPAPWAFAEQLAAENGRLRESAGAAERYARSLAEHADRLEQMRREAEQYAQSLEAEVTRLRSALTPGEPS